MTVAMCPPPQHMLRRMDYKYNMADSPWYPSSQVEDDCVFRSICLAIRKYIRALRDEGYKPPYIRLWKLSRAPDLWPVTPANQYSTKFYAFQPDGDEFPRSVPVTLTKPCDRYKDLGLMSILVRSRGLWMPLRVYLMELTGRAYAQELKNPRLLLLSQQAEWDRNGKTFPLMDLPPEVRAIILRHVMGSKIYPQERSYYGYTYVFRSEESEDFEFEGYEPRDGLFPNYMYEYPKRFNPFRTTAPNDEILRIRGRTGRLIREEALKAAWEGAWKVFAKPAHLQNVLQFGVIPPRGFNWISKVELNFSTAEYFDFFGVSLRPRVHVRVQDSNGPLLGQIPTLRKLALAFPCPYDDGNTWLNGGLVSWPLRPVLNPWEEIAYYSRFEHWGLSDSEYAAYRFMCPSACSRAIIDWILTFAYPHIKHIPNIYLQGYIKSDLKAKWDTIFCTTPGYRNGSFDWDTAMAAIERCPGYMPPPCHCPLPCSLSTNMRQFDYDDEFDPEMEKAVRWFWVENERYPKLFGPDADDLLVTRYSAEAGKWDRSRVEERNKLVGGKFREKCTFG